MITLEDISSEKIQVEIYLLSLGGAGNEVVPMNHAVHQYRGIKNEKVNFQGLVCSSLHRKRNRFDIEMAQLGWNREDTSEYTTIDPTSVTVYPDEKKEEVDEKVLSWITQECIKDVERRLPLKRRIFFPSRA